LNGRTSRRLTKRDSKKERMPLTGSGEREEGVKCTPLGTMRASTGEAVQEWNGFEKGGYEETGDTKKAMQENF